MWSKGRALFSHRLIVISGCALRVPRWRRQACRVPQHATAFSLILTVVSPCFGQTGLELWTGQMPDGHKSGRLLRPVFMRVSLDLSHGAPMQQSTLDPKLADPHDVVEIVPDVVLVARAEKELSRLAHDAASRRTEPKMASDVSAGAAVPPVDTTFRATAVNNQVPGQRQPFGRRAMRAFIGFLMALLAALGSGVAAAAWSADGDAWQAYTDVARRMIARLTQPFVPTSAPPADNAAAPVQPSAAVGEASADAAPTAPAAQPAAPAQAAADSAAAPPAAVLSPDQTQLLQSMASDLTGARQEIEQLKAGIAELETSQDQLSREVANLSEQTYRLSVSAVASPRPATAPVRRPTPAYRPAQATTASVPPPPATPYAPPAAYPPPQPAPYVPPSLAAQPQYDRDAPRPPMPVRQ